jgi:hypothetical protein
MALSSFQKRLGSIFVGLVLLFFVFCRPGVAREPESSRLLVTIGSSRIYGSETSVARQAAIRDAQQAAVQSAAVEIVPGETLVYQFDKIRPLIFGSSDRYIGNFKVLTESQTDEEYHVVMETSVMAGTLRKAFLDAGIQMGDRKMPSVSLFLSEQPDPDVPAQYWWGKGMPNDPAASEKALVESLGNMGFPVTGHRPSDQRKAQGELSDMPELPPSEAIRFASARPSDIVILAHTGVYPAANTLGEEIRSFRAEIFLKAYRVDTGEQIASVQRNAVAADADEIAGRRKALDQAGRLAGAAVAGEIAEKWKAVDGGSRNITVQVTGTRHFESYIRFRRELMELPGVRELAVVERTPDSATLAVSFNGGGRALAGVLVLRQFEAFRLDIQEAAADRITVTLIPATAGALSGMDAAAGAIPAVEQP